MPKKTTSINKLDTFLKDHHKFTNSRHIEGRSSIADVYRKKNRCGLYVLTFENGDIYAGQAVDVTRRFVQHSKNHEDITHISFKRMAKSMLDDEERSLIWALEHQGFILRNITFTSIPKGDSDFELLMSADEQNQWLVDSTIPLEIGTRVNDIKLRLKYKKKFSKFQIMEHAVEVTEFLRRYVYQGIPVPLRSELAFWCTSCLPSYRNGAKAFVYSRININWQEVLTVFTEDDALFFSFHLALTPLQSAYDDTLESMVKIHPELYIDDHFYEPGGHDQIRLCIEGFDAACRILADPAVTESIRLFNLRLMRKGPCTFSRYHCMDLADRILTSTTAHDSPGESILL